MRKKKEKHQRNKGCPSNNESESPTAIPAEETGFRNKLISRFSWCDLSRDPDLKQLIENLTPWVAFKRFLIVVDNVIVAGLFGFFVLWLNNYLGYYENCDFYGAISKSIQDIKSNYGEELLFFLLYYIAFARPVRLTKRMPMEYYFIDRIGGIVIITTSIAVFLFFGIGYLFRVSRFGDYINQYPYILPSIKTCVAFTLILYRRIYLTFHIRWFAPEPPQNQYGNKVKEKLTRNVTRNRFPIVLDNLIAAGLFGFFVLWLNNYMGYHENCDFLGAISKSIQDIKNNLGKEMLFLLLYYLLFARSMKSAERTPHKYHSINKTTAIIMAGITILSFVLTDIYYETSRSAKTDDITYLYPVIVPSIELSVALSLAFYRRVYMKYHFEWFDRKKQK